MTISERKSEWLTLGLALLLALLPLRSLLWMDAWMTQDVQAFEVRVAAMGQAMREGQWLGRWCAMLDGGYGYPLFHYYAPGLYLLAALLCGMGLMVVPAIKVALVLLQWVGVASMFRLGRLFYGRSGALISALLWAFLPYQQVNLFVRGALGEWAALQWLAAALYLTASYVRTQRRAHAVGASVALALMIVSHAVTALAGTALVVVFSLWLYRHEQGRLSLRPMIPIALGLALSAFYWLPALGETQYVRTEAMVDGQYSWRHHFLYPQQWLNVTYWGFGPSMPGPSDGMALHVGLAQALLMGMAWWVWWKKRKQGVPLPWPLLAGSVASAMLLFFTVSASSFLWAHLPLIRYIQFPWRLLGETGLMMALAGGATVGLLQLMRLRLVALVVALIVLGPPWHWNPTRELEPLFPAKPTRAQVMAQGARLTAVDEYLPRTVKEKWPTDCPAEALVVVKGEAKVAQAGKQFMVHVNREATLRYGGYYFPNVRVLAHGKAIAAHPSDPHGLIEFELSSGEHKLEIQRARTPLQRIGEPLSWAAVIALLLWGFMPKRRHVAAVPKETATPEA